MKKETHILAVEADIRIPPDSYRMEDASQQFITYDSRVYSRSGEYADHYGRSRAMIYDYRLVPVGLVSRRLKGKLDTAIFWSEFPRAVQSPALVVVSNVWDDNGQWYCVELLEPLTATPRYTLAEIRCPYSLANGNTHTRMDGALWLCEMWGLESYGVRGEACPEEFMRDYHMDALFLTLTSKENSFLIKADGPAFGGSKVMALPSNEKTG